MSQFTSCSVAANDKGRLACDGIRTALELLSSGRGKLELLTVVYDDLHQFHGGVTLTIRGTGAVEVNALRVNVGSPRIVTATDLLSLVELLKKLKAWEQVVPERQAVPDESRASLVIAYGDERCTVWEWYNDLGKNRRISAIRALMEQIALVK